MNIDHQASFYLKPRSLLSPYNQGEGSLPRNIHSFFLAIGRLISSMQIKEIPIRCSLESSGHLTKHIYVRIRAIWLTKAVRTSSAAFSHSFCPKTVGQVRSDCLLLNMAPGEKANTWLTVLEDRKWELLNESTITECLLHAVGCITMLGLSVITDWFFIALLHTFHIHRRPVRNPGQGRECNIIPAPMYFTKKEIDF